MSENDDVSLWIQQLQEGDAEASAQIWNRYFEKLVRLAQRRLGNMPKREFDQEDVAISAMNSFVRCANEGKFPQLSDRDDVWKLLASITARKVIKQQRRHFAEKRGGGQVFGESVFGDVSESNALGLDQIFSSEPANESADLFAATLADLVRQLGDGKLESIVLRKLEGYTNDEIATQMQCTTRTVERKLERIREKWARHVNDDE